MGAVCCHILLQLTSLDTITQGVGDGSCSTHFCACSMVSWFCHLVPSKPTIGVHCSLGTPPMRRVLSAIPCMMPPIWRRCYVVSVLRSPLFPMQISRAWNRQLGTSHAGCPKGVSASFTSPATVRRLMA